MPTELATKSEANIMSTLILKGDIGKLSENERVEYYKSLCTRLNLDWLTRPFDYLVLKGKQVLYLNKGGAEQLNRVHDVSISITNTERIDDVYIVTARASLPGDNDRPLGRFADSTGAVSVTGLRGDDLANCYMKAETKAKRRATISLLGLAMLDETEVHSVPGAEIRQAVMPTDAPFDAATEAQVVAAEVSRTDIDELLEFSRAHGWVDLKVKNWIFERFGKAGVTKDNFMKSFTRPMLQETLLYITENAVTQQDPIPF